MTRNRFAGAIVALALIGVTALGVGNSSTTTTATPGLASDYLATVTATRCWPPTPAPNYSDATVVAAGTAYAATDATPYSVHPVCGEVVPMAVFVSDSFTDTSGTTLQSHTGETGATWTKHASVTPSDAVISDANRARATLTTNGYYYASGTPATAEYDVQADFYVASIAGFSGIAGRIATGSGTAYLARYHSSNQQWDLYKEVFGSFTLLGSYSQILTVGVTYVVKLEIRDATKRVYIDGVQRISSADNEITAAGKAGFWISGSTTTNTTELHMDNFTATDPAVAGKALPPFQRPWRRWTARRIS